MIQETYEYLLEHHLKEEDMDIYNENRSKYVSSTALKTLVKEGAANYKEEFDNPTFESKPAYILGNAVHTMFLEGLTAYNKRYSIGGPKNANGVEMGITSDAFIDKRKKVMKEEGKELITSKMHKVAMKMRKSLKAHKIITKVMAQGVSERVIRTNLYGVDVQCRYDSATPIHGFPDLKTCRDIDNFKRDARWKYGYLIQAGLYTEIAKKVAPQFPYMPFCFLVVESKKPYRCGIFRCDEDDMDWARMQVMDGLMLLKECRETNVWPTGYENSQTI